MRASFRASETGSSWGGGRRRNNPASTGGGPLAPPSDEGVDRRGSRDPDCAVSVTVTSTEARRARARILDLSSRSAFDDAFLAELSRELQRIVPFDGAFWAGADPLTALATSPARLENVGGDRECQAYWDSEFLVQDFNHFRDLARAPVPAASLYRATGGQPGRSVRFLDVNRPLGFGDELRAVFRTARSTWGFVSLFRAGDAPPFTRAEER